MSVFFFTARLASRYVRRAGQPYLCKWACGGLRCLANEAAQSPIDEDLFKQLKEAKLQKLGSILEVFRENRGRFTGLNSVVALTLIDAEASARARTRQAYQVNMDSVRRAPEVAELVERASTHCERLEPHIFGNLLILVGSFRMYNNTDAVELLVEAAPPKLAELKFSALLSIGVTIKDQPGALSLADLILRSVVDRLEEGKEDLAGNICQILSIMGAVKEGLPRSTFQQFLVVLEKQRGSLSAENVRDVCRSASTLAQRNCMSVLEILGSEVQRVASSASAGCLASIIFYFGENACVTSEFWERLLKEMSGKLPDCSQWSITQVAKGVSECPEICANLKKKFLKDVVDTCLPQLESFEATQLVLLAGAFAKAEYAHRALVEELTKRSRRLVKHFKPWWYPDLLTALAKLGCYDLDLLAAVADNISDFSQFEAGKLKDMAVVFAAANYRDLRMLDILSLQVAQRWQEIPTEDFEVICDCFSKLGYHSDKFDKHKVARLPRQPNVVKQYSQLKFLRKCQREWSKHARHGRKLRYGKKIGEPEWGSVILGRHVPYSV